MLGHQADEFFQLSALPEPGHLIQRKNVELLAACARSLYLSLSGLHSSYT